MCKSHCASTLAQQQQLYASEHRELADLREIVFKEGVDEKEEPPEDMNCFPYKVNRNTIIFGGHDSWVKAIKPMLTGNIRLEPREMQFDLDILRNAEVIWIQPNAMSHGMYYRIINEVRQYNKQIRYFQYASAEKCARQLLENDT